MDFNRRKRVIVYIAMLAAVAFFAIGKSESVSASSPFIINVDGVLVSYEGTAEKVVVPGQVTAIGSKAFYKCKNLKEITLPATINSIGSYAFAGCESLTEITIPNSVTKIGTYAFESCKSLTKVTLSENMAEIKEGLFRNCSKLKSITIPKKVTEFAPMAVEGCTSLTSYQVAVGNSSFSVIGGSLYSKDATTLIKAAPNAAVVTIPQTVKEIEMYAFFDNTVVTKISLPSGLRTIYQYAFANCSNLTTINFPASLIEIGENALLGTKKLTSITVDANNASYKLVGGILYKVMPGENEDDPDTMEVIWCNRERTGTVTFPEVVYGKKIARIGSGAFSGCDKITKVVIPETVKEIGSNTFKGCTSLGQVNIPSAITKIESGTFSGCKALTSITIPNQVTSILPEAFSDCTSMAAIHIPENVNVMDSLVFAGCTSLRDITVAAGNKKFKVIDNILYQIDGTNKMLLRGSVSLSGMLDVPEDVTEIKSMSLADCTKLTGVTITGNAMTSIENPFNGLRSLKTLAIYSEVKSTCYGIVDKDTILFTLPTATVVKKYYETLPNKKYYNKPGELAMPTYTVPTNLTAKRYATLGSIALPKGFSFEKAASTQLKTIGIQEYTVKYTPEDTTYLAVVTGIKVKINVVPREFTITYGLNGGTNASKNPKTYKETKAVSLSAPTKRGYSFAGWFTDQACTKKFGGFTTSTTGNLKLYAKWKLNSYKITYQLAGGKNASGNKTSYNVTSNTFTWKNPTRKGYTFVGWYQGSKKVTSIKKGSIGNVTITAKWKKVSVAKATLTSAKNTKAKTIAMNVKKLSGVDGYSYTFCMNKNFKTGVKTANSSKNTLSLSKFVKGKTYYVRVRAYKKDSTGARVYGAYSKIIKVKITR